MDELTNDHVRRTVCGGADQLKEQQVSQSLRVTPEQIRYRSSHPAGTGRSWMPRGLSYLQDCHITTGGISGVLRASERARSLTGHAADLCVILALWWPGNGKDSLAESCPGRKNGGARRRHQEEK
jgi:hypothetical protein